MQQHFGFVLRTYFPQKHKISLFDEQLGRIEGLILRTIVLQAVSSGMLLTYNLKPKGQLFVLDGVNIYKAPLRAAQHDIYFLHQVLELCYYFLPLHQETPAIFHLINFVVKSSEQLGTSFAKKLFLLRFFSCLGMHPEEELYNSDLLQNLLSQPIDSMLKTDVVVAESKLDQWLTDFIVEHPQKAQFKTVISGYK